ncbi:hypothetical protein [Oscillibacter ruminantium]|uniref:hypothetical protein n=1 Tax=Oscillibacter ruminantium TaxID=1263547 RepID=UPI003333F42E
MITVLLVRAAFRTSRVLHTLMERIRASRRKTKLGGSETQTVTICSKYVDYVYLPL